VSQLYESFWLGGNPVNRQAPGGQVALGMWCTVDRPGKLVAFRYFWDGGLDASRAIMLCNIAGGLVLGAAKFNGGAVSATPTWQTAYVHPAVVLTPGTLFQVSLVTQDGIWWENTGALAGGALSAGPITVVAPAVTPSGHNGTLSAARLVPTGLNGSSLPGLDFLFQRS
jgi:hypothetical protein